MAQRQISPFELEYMFKVIGQAIWHLQYLEVALDQLITLKVDIRTPGRVPEAEAWARLARNQRDTLGDSIKKAEKNQALDETLDEQRGGEIRGVVRLRYRGDRAAGGIRPPQAQGRGPAVAS